MTEGSDGPKARQFGRWLVALALVVAGLAGCGSGTEQQRGQLGFVRGFLGGVAADEPRAALVGRDILSAGGNAMDAATAVYFALTVTYPAAASLGGGGVCVLHDWRSKRSEALDFIGGPGSEGGPAAQRPTAVPGAVRGFFALHSKYGVLPWSQLVSPAENLARFGTPVSRALARELARVGDPLLVDPGARAVFGRADGGVLREGDFLIQVELASVLSRIRNLGPGDFYAGQTGRTLVAAFRQVGGSVGLEDLRTYAPAWRETLKIALGNQTVHFAPPPAAGGGTAAVLWSLLTRRDAYQDAGPDARPHVLAEMAMRAYADRGRWMQGDGASAVPADQLVAAGRLDPLLAGFRADRHTPAEQLTPPPVARPENPSATGFVVVDREGSAVACAVTLNNPFGIGRITPGIGILPAMAPGQGGRGPYSLGPMLVVNHRVNEFFYASAAAGGVTAPTAMIAVAAATLLGRSSLEDAMGAPRVHHGGAPDLVYHEPTLSPAEQAALTARGHRLGATPAIGLVNAVHCAQGLPPKPESCAVRSDPRGAGLAATADQ